MSRIQLFLPFLLYFTITSASTTQHPVLFATNIYDDASIRQILYVVERLDTRLNDLTDRLRDLTEIMVQIKADVRGCTDADTEDADTEPAPEPTPEPTPVLQPECDKKADSGDCTDFTILWYYENSIHDCLPFYYGGCGGNNNRYLSLEECTQHCWVAPPQPQPDPAPQNVCEMRVDSGSCNNYTVKWHYDSEQDGCFQFVYFGCGGTDNRFDTEDACKNRCVSGNVPDNSQTPSETRNCYLPPDQGECNENLARWYYNRFYNRCDVFTYGGCGGNANNYASEDDCKWQCFDVPDICSLPLVRGHCKDYSTRWYYDKNSSSCYEFQFTGCGGNRNNFVAEADCWTYCKNETFPIPAPTTQYATYPSKMESVTTILSSGTSTAILKPVKSSTTPAAEAMETDSETKGGAKSSVASSVTALHGASFTDLNV